MNSAINTSLVKIHTEIPEEILELAFKNRKNYERDYTLDQMIDTYIFQYRVKTMMNLFGGKVKDILLKPQYMEKLHREVLDGMAAISPFAIYRIPSEEREDLDMIDVLGVRFISQVSLSVQASPFINHSNSMDSYGQAILSSHTGDGMYSISNAEVLAGNMLRLTPAPFTMYQYVATVRLAHDSEYTNLSNNVIDIFSDYCVAATKLYIYNKLIIPLDRAYVEAGAEITAVLRIVETYNDSAQRCKELEENLQGACFLSPDMQRKFLEYII